MASIRNVSCAISFQFNNHGSTVIWKFDYSIVWRREGWLAKGDTKVIEKAYFGVD